MDKTFAYGVKEIPLTTSRKPNHDGIIFKSEENASTKFQYHYMWYVGNTVRKNNLDLC
jgi:hypothetical protein